MPSFARLALLPAVLLALATPTLRAATLNCPSLGSYTLSGYSFDIAAATNSNGASQTLTAQVPVDATYTSLFETIATGKRISRCTLTEGSASLMLEEVTITDLKILAGNYYTLYTASPVMQFVLNPSKVEISSGT